MLTARMPSDPRVVEDGGVLPPGCTRFLLPYPGDGEVAFCRRSPGECFRVLSPTLGFPLCFVKVAQTGVWCLCPGYCPIHRIAKSPGWLLVVGLKDSNQTHLQDALCGIEYRISQQTKW